MEIQTEIFKLGHGYAVRIPKALVDCKILQEKKTYKIVLQTLDNAPIAQWTSNKQTKFNNFFNFAENSGVLL